MVSKFTSNINMGAGALTVAVLLVIGLENGMGNYLLFHSLAELFAVIVACGIFVIAWNVRGIMDHDYLLLIGIAYLFVAILDVFHTLGYGSVTSKSIYLRPACNP
mgnify:CR=1 FL=1